MLIVFIRKGEEGDRSTCGVAFNCVAACIWMLFSFSVSFYVSIFSAPTTTPKAEEKNMKKKKHPLDCSHHQHRTSNIQQCWQAASHKFVVCVCPKSKCKSTTATTGARSSSNNNDEKPNAAFSQRMRPDVMAKATTSTTTAASFLFCRQFGFLHDFLFHLLGIPK